MRHFLKSILFAVFASLMLTQCTNDPGVSTQGIIKNNIVVDSTLLGDGTATFPLSLAIDVVTDSISASIDEAGVNTYQAILLGANGSLTSTTVASNGLSAAPVVAYSAEGVYTVTLADEFTANKTTVFLTLGSATDGVVLKGVRTSADVVTLSSFLVTDGTTAADFIGTVNLEINVAP